MFRARSSFFPEPIMKSENRIHLQMNVIEAVGVLAEGNPGAATVLMRLMQEVEAIDPKASMGWLLYFLSLDTLRLYGPKIWLLYKDCCGENITNFCSVIRANQFGLIGDGEIANLVDERRKRDFGHLVERCEKEFIPAIREKLGEGFGLDLSEEGE
jgi:hypothetical protein